MNVSIINNINKLKECFQDDSVNILITGDLCSDRKVANNIKSERYDELLNDFVHFSKEADLSITNLECPLLSNRGIPIIKAGPVLSGPFETVNALEYFGFNLICLANNHIMDYGEKGLVDTLNALESKGLYHTGAGMSLREATQPLFLSIKGYKIAFLNITEHEFSIASDHRGGAAPLDEVTNYYQIRNAKNQADILIVIIHGGHEMYPLPSPRMTKVYRYFGDIGADAVIGHHAHVFSGYEIYNGVPIFYNLGNFLFDRNESDINWYKGYAVNLRIQKNSISHIYLIPYTQFFNGFGLHILNSSELIEFNQKILELNSIIADADRLKLEFELFIHNGRVFYLSNIMGMNKLQKKFMKMNLYPKFMIRRRKLMNRLNHIRCQAHRDIIIEVLKNETRVH